MDTEIAKDDGIEHVVLLMLENHSFDQMLGALQEFDDAIDGVTSQSAATRSNARLDGRLVFQAPTKERQMKFDPHHEQVDALAHLQNNNGGFVSRFELAYKDCTDADLQDVMGYYPLNFLPALHTLGREFTVCDRWFSSLPGPTWPNRFFALSGTCNGQPIMPSGIEQLEPHWYTEQNQDTIFDRLNDVNRRWKIYFYDFPSALVLKQLRAPHNLESFEPIDNFFKAANTASESSPFPEFVFIEPQYFGVAQNDDHPPHNVMKAEKLIADVYNALRGNPGLWAKTLLVVVYDEHGGFYDHVPPGPTVAPDSKTSAYAFDRFGVRVPAILVSPHCARRVEKTIFDHTSLLRYLADKWGFAPLGERSARANSIAVAIDPALARTDTTSFIRVSNSSLIPDDPETEKNAENWNQTALHHFAEFLLKDEERAAAGAVKLAADAARIGTAWQRAMHSVGTALTRTGHWFSAGFRQSQIQRVARTASSFEQLKARSGRV